MKTSWAVGFRYSTQILPDGEEPRPRAVAERFFADLPFVALGAAPCSGAALTLPSVPDPTLNGFELAGFFMRILLLSFCLAELFRHDLIVPQARKRSIVVVCGWIELR